MGRFAPTIRMCVLVLFAGLTVVPAWRPQAAAQKRGFDPAFPNGFQRLDDSFWEGPWVFTGFGSERDLPRWHNYDALRGRPNTSMLFHFDDGTVGTLRSYAGPCLNLAECGGPRGDCGCFENDSYWIDVINSTGKTSAHLHLWAAYGSFDVVPIDLVDGRGDELIIVRTPQHAAPPHGPDLKIWKLDTGRAVDLLDRLEEWFDVAGYVGTVQGAIPCARWQTRLVVDLGTARPRSIRLLPGFAAEDWPESGCLLSDEGAKQVAELRRDRRLRFADGKYRLR